MGNSIHKVSIPRFRKFELFNQTFLGAIADYILSLHTRHNECIPDFSKSKNIYLFSDYSGDAKNSKYYTYSFVMADEKSVLISIKNFKLIRKKYNIGNRKFSYKGFNDKVKQNALQDYLNITNNINGIVVNFAISKDIKNLFPTNIHSLPHEISNLSQVKPRILDRISTVTHLASFLISSLCDREQNIFWFTDNDPIAANDDLTTLLTRMTAIIVSNIIEFDLGHLRCGTSKCDMNNQIEDFLSIADISAGITNIQVNNDIFHDIPSFFFYNGNFPNKVNILSPWYFSANSPLKKYIFIINNKAKSPQSINVLFQHFYDQ